MEGTIKSGYCEDDNAVYVAVEDHTNHLTVNETKLLIEGLQQALGQVKGNDTKYVG